MHVGGHYLNYSMHHCRKHGTFASIHPISMSKLPPYVRDSFPYVLMDASGVTKRYVDVQHSQHHNIFTSSSVFFLY